MLDVSCVRSRTVATALLVLAAAAASARAQEPPLRWRPGVRLGQLPPTALRNANGSPRVVDTAAYAAVWRRIAPALEAWARDPRLDIDPNLLAALLAKESGGDSLAVSGAPALGLAQLTPAADADLRAMVRAAPFAWMRREVERWPRDPAVHDLPVTRAGIDSLLASGAVTSRSEYLFDPLTSARASAFWLRLLINKWTTDAWPGGYGRVARERIAHGARLTPSELVDLVVVSYNRGYREVFALVTRYGARWRDHLADLGAPGAEAADYLERIRTYAALFASAADSAGARGP